MALKTTFVVQTFELTRKRLVPGAKEIAPTESGALKKAQDAWSHEQQGHRVRAMGRPFLDPEQIHRASLPEPERKENKRRSGSRSR